MTAKRVVRYLDLSYRRDVLGERISPNLAVENDEAFVANVKERLSHINKIGLGANLASRDFAAYHQRKALEQALATIEQRQKDAPEQQG